MGIDETNATSRLDAENFTHQQITAIESIHTWLKRLRIHFAASDDAALHYESNLKRNSSSVYPHPFHAFRNQCGGLSESSSHETDPVRAAIRSIAIQNYPGLLIETHQNQRDLIRGSFHRNEAVVRLFREHPDFSSLFLSTEILARSVLIVPTGGRLFQPDIVPDWIVLTAFMVSRIRGQQNFGGYLEQVFHFLEVTRQLASGKSVTVPVFHAFRQIGLPNSVKTKDGELRPMPQSAFGLFPKETWPHKSSDGKVFGIVYETAIQISVLAQAKYDYDWGSDDNDPFEEAIRPHRTKIKKTEIKLNREQQTIESAVSLAGDRSPAVAALSAWRYVANPLQMDIVWRTASRSLPSPHWLTESEAKHLGFWIKKAKRFEGRLGIAQRRIQSALVNRNQPIDAFVDAIIAWDNLFGSKSGGEIRFRISMAIACLLETDPNKRLELQKEFQSLFDLRSDLVHGSKDTDAVEWPEINKKKERSIEVILECLRVLLRDHPSLLTDPDKARKIIAGSTIATEQSD